MNPLHELLEAFVPLARMQYLRQNGGNHYRYKDEDFEYQYARRVNGRSVAESELVTDGPYIVWASRAEAQFTIDPNKKSLARIAKEIGGSRLKPLTIYRRCIEQFYINNTRLERQDLPPLRFQVEEVTGTLLCGAFTAAVTWDTEDGPVPVFEKVGRCSLLEQPYDVRKKGDGLIKMIPLEARFLLD